MKIRYVVVSAIEEPVKVTAQLDGKDVEATVPGLTVELQTECEGMTHTFRLRPEKLDDALELYAPGNVIESTHRIAK